MILLYIYFEINQFNIHFFSIQNMIRNNKTQIENEYEHLKVKVEDQIRQLQDKLSKNTQIHYHKTINSPNHKHNILSQYSETRPYCLHNKTTCNIIHSHSHRHCCNIAVNNPIQSNCHHLCHSRCNSINLYQNSRQNILLNIAQKNNNLNYQRINTQKTHEGLHTQRTKSVFYNQKVLEQVILKNLETQKLLSRNVRLLSDKIQNLQKLQSQRNSSFNSANNNIFNHKKRLPSRSNSAVNKFYNYRPKSYSTNKDIQRKKWLKNVSPTNVKLDKSNSKSNIKIGIKKKDSKKIFNNSQNEYLLNVKSEKILKSPKLTSTKLKKPIKNNQYWQDEYYGKQKNCPIHSKPQLKRLKSRQKQIYQDTYHRNRKHQTDHLLGSLKQQQILRNKLIQKILKKQGLKPQLK